MERELTGKVTPPADPFVRAEECTPRVKVFMYGESGSGKTCTALSFPSPVVADLEAGTNQYGARYTFSKFPRLDVDSIEQNVLWLAAHKHPYRTLVIDPITVFWSAYQSKWDTVFLARNREKKGYKEEFYKWDFQDWKVVKDRWSRFMRMLNELDMNVVCTARLKTIETDGRVVETFDGEKSLPFEFDLVLQTFKRGKDYLVRTHKDRSGHLPFEWPLDYATIASAFGDALTRPAKPIELSTQEQKQRIVDLSHGKGMSDKEIEKALEKHGGWEDLTYASAEAIIAKLEG